MAVISAAYRVSTATIASDADDRDGGAGYAKEYIEVLEDDTQKAQQGRTRSRSSL